MAPFILGSGILNLSEVRLSSFREITLYLHQTAYIFATKPITRLEVMCCEALRKVGLVHFLRNCLHVGAHVCSENKSSEMIFKR